MLCHLHGAREQVSHCMLMNLASFYDIQKTSVGLCNFEPLNFFFFFLLFTCYTDASFKVLGGT